MWTAIHTFIATVLDELHGRPETDTELKKIHLITALRREKNQLVIQHKGKQPLIGIISRCEYFTMFSQRCKGRTTTSMYIRTPLMSSFKKTIDGLGIFHQ